MSSANAEIDLPRRILFSETLHASEEVDCLGQVDTSEGVVCLLGGVDAFG